MITLRQICIVVTLLLVTGSHTIAESKPNILLIVSDDQGYHDLGCAGNKDILTPNLDQLAKDGVRLTNFYVSWPACTPSRGSILTGRYPQRNGLYDMIRNNVTDFGKKMTEEEYAVSPEMTIGLDRREVLISNVLKTNGYRTGMVGKWDSGRAKRFLPPRRGFDFFYGFANTGIDYWTHERYGVPSMFRGLERVKDKGYATDLFERESLRFLKEKSDKPWFLYLAFNAPHSASNLSRPGVQAKDEYLKMYPKLDAKKNSTRHKACVTNMDYSIGKVLEQVRAMGQEKDTLVIFFSDNGGSGAADNGVLRGRKAQMFEGGLRVPLIARWPGVLPAGKVNNEFLTSLEIFPTLCAVSGSPHRISSSEALRAATRLKGVKLDGFNCLPVLQGKAKSERETMFWQRRSDRAARVGNWKWVDSQKGTGLFDLSKDISEKNDLSKSHPEKLAELKKSWQHWRKEMDEADPRGPFRDY